MKRIAYLSIAALCATLALACTHQLTREEQIEQVEALEDSLFVNPASAVEEATASRMIGLYTAFADAYPADSLAPSYLLKAADVATNALLTDQAIALFDRIIKDYPDFKDVPICYFMRGQAYEQNQQYDKAREAYNEFLSKYPDHYMAESTRQVLPMLGLSPEEMLQQVLANNAE